MLRFLSEQKFSEGQRKANPISADTNMNGWVLDQMSHLRFLIGKSTDRTSRGIRNSLSLGIGCNTAIRNSLMGRAQCVDRYIYQAWYIHHSRMRSFFPLVLPRRRTVICRRSVLVIFATSVYTCTRSIPTG